MPVVLLSKPLLNHSAQKSARLCRRGKQLGWLKQGVAYLPGCWESLSVCKSYLGGRFSWLAFFGEPARGFCWIFPVIYAGFSGNSVEIIIQ